MKPCKRWKWRHEIPCRHGHLAACGGNLPSVIIFRLKDMRAPNVSQRLFSVINQQSQSLNNGAVLSVTEQKVRIRTLPI